MKTVYLATLENSAQASILQSALENEDIKSFLKNENMSSVLNIPDFQIQVEVLEEDYEKAVEVLKQGFPYLVND